MIRNATFSALLILLTAASASQAQGRRQGGWMNQFGRASATFGQLANSEYLQKEMKLTASQLKRMKEINLQMQGTRALLTLDVSSALNITETQRKKIEEIQRSAFSGMFSGIRDLFRRGQGGRQPNFDDMRKKFEDAQKATDKKIFEVLTRTQRSKFEKMKGKPIDRSKIRGLFGGPRKKRPDV